MSLACSQDSNQLLKHMMVPEKAVASQLSLNDFEPVEFFIKESFSEGKRYAAQHGG
jgi:hypothetical protein